ncbi:Tfp pilus assembly protein FimT/FimU [Agaribacterium sp. ZY112]|uniref:Tfp pilus assembly protein FimT/FimU n=1 Tax=Agaribacterium sp. ZY112 TaxID=3233574 RepID=UPI00352621A4
MVQVPVRGFTLVELITVMILIGILAVSATSLFSKDTYSLQKSRDQLVAAFFSAQQLALAQRDRVQLICTSTAIDIRRDLNGNGSFEASESQTLDGVSYPLSLAPGQSLTPATFNFDRLGRTTGRSLTITGGGSAVIQISNMGALDY